MNTLSERLKKAMEMRGFSQAKLAESAGMSQPSIWKITAGKSKTSKKIVDIAKVLDVSPDWLANGAGGMFNNLDQTKNSDFHLDKDKAEIHYNDVKAVRIWDESGPTDSFTVVPDLITSLDVRAYLLKHDTGYPDLPAGSLVVIDTNEKPASRDYVLADIEGKTSVYRYSIGAGGTLLDPDSRVEPISIEDGVKIIGLIIFMSRSLKR
ncbi:helix-turn-helix domain-containing protein [Pantoea sp. NPDC088449]|uniref:helix-turn-helix domain-containing protein n=1 Tax=Pantoea sp. NPDC088449 TaxID=3364392 RepID=UPI003803FFFD